MAKRKKVPFNKRFQSLSAIGKEFNLSAIATGKELKRLGYRQDDGTPTEECLNEGLAVSTPLKNGAPHYRWDARKVRAILAKHHSVDDLLKPRGRLKEMVAIMQSDAWEMGGGIEYKVAVHEFFTLVHKLPLIERFDDVIGLIGEMKTSKEDKDYLLDVVLSAVAGKPNIPLSLINRIFETNDWRIIVSLAENTSLDEVIRAKAKRYSDQLRPRPRG